MDNKFEFVKEFVEGYCQLTGRPAFTITVDEYIKFHQVALLNQPKNEICSVPVKEQIEEVPNKKAKTLENSVVEDVVQKSDYENTNQSISFKKEEESVSNKEITKKNGVVKNGHKPSETKESKVVDQKQVALNLLKSIQG